MPLERCPNCRARVEAHASQCRRCEMELDLLRRTQEAASALRQEAVARLAAGDRSAAEEALRKARALHADPLCESLLGYLRTGGASSHRPAPRPDATGS